MESIWRGAATYLFVWLVFRIAGKRSLAQITTFDAVLLLIISETTQAALLDNDNSMTNSFLLIATILGIEVVTSYLKCSFPTLEKVIDGAPLVLLDERGILEQHLKHERMDRDDILSAARHQGVGTMEEVRYAVLEQSGGITIVAKK